MSKVNQVSYTSTNVYARLNGWSDKTKNVWLVFHGIGYLSQYFLKYFKHLDPEENFIIAPQAPSKYYLDKNYKHVGASWLTKENTTLEIENNMNYIDAIYESENLANAPRLLIFGYSQGVSMATRWMANRKISCSNLIMHSGRLPTELTEADFSFETSTLFSFIYGDKDPYVSNNALNAEKQRIKSILPANLEFLTFDGGHEVNRDLISKFA